MDGRNKMELLAPVGSWEALKAAVQNGADAVYLGGKQFSARQYAQNFDLQELQEAVRYAHLHHVRVYVAINTLIDNEEFPELMEYLYALYNINVDAVIVQDLGVAAAIRRLLPEMELHASTQMTIHNSAGARFLQQMGFSRLILAREVSLKNIELIRKNSSIPLEVFVHGALCVCYSGQCLMSSMIGGRSGNRGRCAQPCRLPYKLVDSQGRELKAGHLLSPRDLKMIEHLPLLRKSGVISLKVEGRMKRPEYVAIVIRNYREALDSFELHPQASRELTQIFNRDFTTGYFLEKPGAHLMSYQRPNNRGLYLGRVVSYDAGTKKVTVALEEPLRVGDGYEIWVTRGGRIAGEIKSLWYKKKKVEKADAGQVSFLIDKGRPQAGDRVFKTFDLELMDKAKNTFLTSQGVKKYPLDLKLDARQGQPVRLLAEDEQGNSAAVEGEYLAEKAKNQPFTAEMAEKQLGRLGNTIFYLRNLEINCEENLMIPASELNNLRRRVVDSLEKQRLLKYEKRAVSVEEYNKRVISFQLGATHTTAAPTPKANPAGISVLVGDMQSLKTALSAGCRVIYFGGEKLRRKKGFEPREFAEAVKICHHHGAQAVLLLPRIYHEEKAEEIKGYCEKGREAGVDGFLAGNLGVLQLAREMGLKGVRADYTLNIFNTYALRELLRMGVEQVTLSPELTLLQMQRIRSYGQGNLECIIHGRLPLMITEHCTIGINSGCRAAGGKDCSVPCLKGEFGLKDRMNMVFPLESDENCRMLIYNPKTLSMLDRLPALLDSGMDLFRIEARREEPAWIKQVIDLYLLEMQRYREMGDKYQVRKESLDTLNRLSPDGFTTGHYFRGVL